METPARIALVLEVDRTFSDYAIQVKPEEARQFVQLSGDVGSKVDESVFQLLTLIDETIPPADRGPDHPSTGQRHHRYRIGRQMNRRVVTLEIMKANFPPDHNFRSLLETFQGYAGAVGALFESEGDNNGWSVIFLWVEGSRP